MNPSADPSPLSLEPLDENGAGDWITTYADLVTLLLVFFVLLFSISSLDVKRFRQAMMSIQVSLGQSLPPVSLGELVGGDQGVLEGGVRLDDLTGLRPSQPSVLHEVQQTVARHRLGDSIDAYIQDGKVIIQVRGTVLFDSGRAALNPDGIPVLDEIAAIIRRFPEYAVNIKGHTDDLPIRTPRFPSNWELSAIRATTVLKRMIAQGVEPRRLTATGYGAAMPLVPNDSEAHRARNRRVEFVLEKTAP